MPFKDKERAREYHRERRRKERAGAVQDAEGLQENVCNPTLSIKTPGDLQPILASEINKVRDAGGDVFVRARTIGYLAGVVIRVLEVGELEERLSNLEREMAEKESTNVH